MQSYINDIPIIEHITFPKTNIYRQDAVVYMDKNLYILQMTLECEPYYITVPRQIIEQIFTDFNGKTKNEV